MAGILTECAELCKTASQPPPSLQLGTRIRRPAESGYLPESANLPTGYVTPAGLTAEGLAEGGFGGQRGDSEDFITGLQRVAAAAGKDLVAAHDRDDDGAVGEVQFVGAPADGGGVLVQGDLDEGDAAVLGSQQRDDVLDADGGVQQPGENRRGGDGGIDTPVLGEQPRVLGIVDPGDDPGDAVGVLGEQAHHEVVLVVAGGRDDGVDGLEAGSIQHGGLARVAGDDDAPTA